MAGRVLLDLNSPVFQARNGKPAHSFRLSQKYRALAYREGDYLRVLSLHLDHDSAYKGW